MLALGDIAPADAKLLGIGASGESIESDIQVDQSSLTGESMPVKKKPGNLIYSSCVIKQGQQQAIVVRTGADTFIGKTANLISVTTDSGRFQKVINYIGNFLIIVSVVLVLILFVYDLVEQRNLTGSITQDQVLAILNEMVVLTIAAIPVGLPTVMSVTMAIGAKQLSKRQVIVKRLTAVEEFASVSILCSDKTGTLTQSKMVLTRLWRPSTGFYSVSGLGLDVEGEVKSESDHTVVTKENMDSGFQAMVNASALCNMSEVRKDKQKDEWVGIGDPTEVQYKELKE
ncbi:hypothetical protein G6F68_011394 [Rhizopus microsporus]|nr:hypothetical protein G6F68_011394 [Rhizopus microsporus]